MNKETYLKKLDELELDKSRYCIISGGAMLMHGLKETTNDIDIKVLPSYFEELKERFTFNKSPKFDYLYELGDEIELAVQDFKDEDVEFVDGYPVELLEIELQWKIEHKRDKDKEAIEKIKAYLASK
ncbi:MAG: hypothetical protein IKH36_03195 [Bacilli bacterium]|nr:hypothetical protein [Bacilli bacterium]